MIVNYKCPSCNSILALENSDIINDGNTNVIQCLLCRTFVYFDVKEQWRTGDLPKEKDLNSSEVIN